MSWQPMKTPREEIAGKVLFRKYKSLTDVYIPAATRELIGIDKDWYFRVNCWKSKTESENKHKLLIQFMKDKQEPCKKLQKGKFYLSVKLIQQYVNDLNGLKDSSWKIQVPIIRDNGNIIIDLRDLRNGKGDNDGDN